MRNDVIPYLTYKIVECSSDHFSNMGFITKEQIRKELLLNNFSSQDCNTAIDYCVSQGFIDLYYKISCPNCNHINYIYEQDYDNKKSFKRLKKRGLICSHCKNVENISLPLKTVYCIPQKFMGKDGVKNKDKTYKYEKGMFERFINFLLPCLR